MMARMPFGAHKGRRLDELEDGYLTWLQSIELREPLRSAVAAEVARRAEEERRAAEDERRRADEERRRTTSRRRSPPPEVVEAAKALVSAGLHALARQHHPDRGGRTEDMQLVNNAADLLRDLVERAERAA